MSSASRAVRVVHGPALAVLVLLAGCHWLPAHRGAAPSTDRSEAQALEPTALPPLPNLRPISDQEALGNATPTPLLDAALVRARGAEQTLVDDLDDRPPPPPPPALEPPPEPLHEPGPPADPWTEGLQRLRVLAHERATTEGADRATWDARERLLTFLAEGPDDESARWETVLSALAAANQPIDSMPEPPKPAAPASEPVPEEPVLEIVELRLCRKVNGFGSYEPADPDACKAGQLVFLYCEMEGVQARSEGDLYRYQLKSTVEVLPETVDKPLWSQALGTADDVCHRRRRDYYLHGRFQLPDNLAPGRYRLRLVQRDQIADRETARAIAITIRP
jgi:hypothetical protein